MSNLAAEAAVLSREELDALLASVADGRLAAERAGSSSRPFLGLAGASRPARLAPLLRLLDDFAAAQSSALATLYQAPVELTLAAWEELSLRELAPALRETDRVALLRLGASPRRAFLVLGRPLVFGWLSLAFGARPEQLERVLPTRPYTKIEEGFLCRVAAELAEQLGRSWAPRQALDVCFERLEEPAVLAEAARAPYLVVSFDVKGLGELCRLRLLLPLDLFESSEARDPAPRPACRTSAEASILDTLLGTRLEARVEVGGAELSLARIAGLCAGELIPLEPADPQGLLVRLEGRPKFRAERGSVAGRLAVRITGAIDPA